MKNGVDCANVETFTIDLEWVLWNATLRGCTEIPVSAIEHDTDQFVVAMSKVDGVLMITVAFEKRITKIHRHDHVDDVFVWFIKMTYIFANRHGIDFVKLF